MFTLYFSHTLLCLTLKLLNIGLGYLALWLLTHVYTGLYNIVSDYISPITHISFLIIVLYIISILLTNPYIQEYFLEDLAHQLNPKARVPGYDFWWR